MEVSSLPCIVEGSCLPVFSFVGLVVFLPGIWCNPQHFHSVDRDHMPGNPLTSVSGFAAKSMTSNIHLKLETPVAFSDKIINIMPRPR